MKRLFAALGAAVVMAASAVSAFASIPEEYAATNTIPDERLKPRVVDDADILSDSEESKLLEKLDRISEAHQIDVVLFTCDSLGERTPQEYADDYYDYNGFGMGDGYDGFVLMISMADHDTAFSGHGKGVEIFTDYGQDYLWEQILPEMKDGDYYGAFDEYADLSEKFIQEWEKGTPYDTNHRLKGKLSFGWVVAAIVGGLVIGGIRAEMVKSQLTSVSMQHGADDYIHPGSFNVTTSRDTFMYKNTKREYIEPSSSGSRSGGGTSTHHSSSGRSHSGSSRKF